VGDFVIWGDTARGFDMRNYTNGTLHFLGTDSPDQWYCNLFVEAQTLEFGVTRCVKREGLLPVFH
jgi:hypothetical protein